MDDFRDVESYNKHVGKKSAFKKYLLPFYKFQTLLLCIITRKYKLNNKKRFIIGGSYIAHTQRYSWSVHYAAWDSKIIIQL